MNNLDKNFELLYWEIKRKNIGEIYEYVLEHYLKIDEYNRFAIESFLKRFGYWGNLDSGHNDFEELYRRCDSLKNHIDDYRWLYEKLGDYRSKNVLLGILYYWYNSDFTVLERARETNYNQYFDLDLIKVSPEEVFVDVGAYTGDTILSYINTFGFDNYKKIYAYEITQDSFTTMCSNLEQYPNIVYGLKAVSDTDKTLYVSSNVTSSSANVANTSGLVPVSAVSLDADIDEAITMIKMDIEGAEKEALTGAIKHIQKDSPKLLISVYHNHQDLWKIPRMIDLFNENYDFYLRYFGNQFYPTETCLIAIPKNNT